MGQGLGRPAAIAGNSPTRWNLLWEDFSLEDVLAAASDAPEDPQKEGEILGGGIAVTSMASSVGIIGGADGPTALYVGAPQPPVCRVAYSGLRFVASAEQVTWGAHFSLEIRGG